jgi:hypothetical protein
MNRYIKPNECEKYTECLCPKCAIKGCKRKKICRTPCSGSVTECAMFKMKKELQVMENAKLQ